MTAVGWVVEWDIGVLQGRRKDGDRAEDGARGHGVWDGGNAYTKNIVAMREHWDRGRSQRRAVQSVDEW